MLASGAATISICLNGKGLGCITTASCRSKRQFHLTMLKYGAKWKLCGICRKLGQGTGSGWVLLSGFLLASIICSVFLSASAGAKQANAAPPVVVQPGAPGQPSKTLPASTRATLPRPSHAEIEFMQGMIMHHSQAVEMTALIASHT